MLHARERLIIDNRVIFKLGFDVIRHVYTLRVVWGNKDELHPTDSPVRFTLNRHGVRFPAKPLQQRPEVCILKCVTVAVPSESDVPIPTLTPVRTRMPRRGTTVVHLVKRL